MHHQKKADQNVDSDFETLPYNSCLETTILTGDSVPNGSRIRRQELFLTVDHDLEALTLLNDNKSSQRLTNVRKLTQHCVDPLQGGLSRPGT